MYFNIGVQNSIIICKCIFKRLERKFVSNFLAPLQWEKIPDGLSVSKLTGNSKLKCVVWCCQGLRDV